MLFLHYEDLHSDLPTAVALIARFLGVGAGDGELQALAARQASIDFMRQFPTKCEGVAHRLCGCVHAEARSGGEWE